MAVFFISFSYEHPSVFADAKPRLSQVFNFSSYEHPSVFADAKPRLSQVFNFSSYEHPVVGTESLICFLETLCKSFPKCLHVQPTNRQMLSNNELLM